MSVFSSPVFCCLGNDLRKSKDSRHRHNNEEHHEEVKKESTRFTVKISHEVKHQVERNGVKDFQG